MNIWCVANQKGGVGKTTTAISLAGVHAIYGERTLLIDLDPQGSLSSYFGFNPETVDSSVYDVFTTPSLNRKTLFKLIRPTGIRNLFIIPASINMATLDRKVSHLDGKGLIVSHCLDLLSSQFGNVYLDCAPALGILMVNAIAACDHLIVPVQTECLSLHGLRRMLSTIAMIEHSRGFNIPYTIVPTLFDQRTRASLISLEEIENDYKDKMSEEIIPVDTQIRDASKLGIPITHLNIHSRGSIAYQNLDYELAPLPRYAVKVAS